MSRATVLVCSVWVLWGCSGPGGTPDGAVGSDAGHCTGAATCGARECGVDACGRPCGECGDGGVCDSFGRCRATCTREPATSFCDRAADGGKTCGAVTDVDACSGQQRTESCGACAAGFTCGTDNTCRSACTPEPATAFCARMALLGKVCGTVTDVEPCTGQPRTESCGSCTSGQTCSASNTCVGSCQPESVQSFCTRLGKACGEVTAPDNCQVQRQYLCGMCTNGACINNGCCAYEDKAAFCARMAGTGKACGVVSGTSCGAARQEDCGTTACAQGTVCNYNTNACATCTQETQAEFCARLASSGFECGQVTGVDNCTQLPRVVNCGACAGSIQCSNNRCSSTGGTCAAPLTLQVDPSNPDRFTAQGNTANGTAALSTGCSTATSGGEVAYAFTIGGTTPRSLAATVKALPGSLLGPALSLRSACASTTNETCRVGASMASVRLNSVSPGSSFLVVDSAGAAAQGPYSLEVVLAAPLTAPANDTCATAASAGTVGATGWTTDGTIKNFSVNGSTVGATSDGAGTCGSHTGGDVVYTLTVPSGSTASGTIRVSSTSADYLPALYLRRTCADAAPSNEVACASATTPGSATLSLTSLPAGTYAVHVDGVSGTAGPFNLQISVTGQ